MPKVSSWLELSDDEVSLLVEAFEESPLAAYLNVLAGATDAGRYNAYGKYVPKAIEVARSLATYGLLSLLEYPRQLTRDDVPRRVDDSEILPIVTNPRNWWLFDPEDPDTGDTTEEQRNYESWYSPTYTYVLLPSDKAELLSGVEIDSRIPDLSLVRARSANQQAEERRPRGNGAL